MQPVASVKKSTSTIEGPLTLVVRPRRERSRTAFSSRSPTPAWSNGRIERPTIASYLETELRSDERASLFPIGFHWLPRHLAFGAPSRNRPGALEPIGLDQAVDTDIALRVGEVSI